MEANLTRAEMKEVFEEMWQHEDYRKTFERALRTSRAYAPLLSKVAVALNTQLGGSLGMRSTRKQLQAIMHFVSGNLDMRINSNSAQPSTFFYRLQRLSGRVNLSIMASSRN